LPYAFRLAFVRLLGAPRDLARHHYQRLCGALDARTGAVLEFPGGVRLTVDAATLTLSDGPLAPHAISREEIELPFEGALGAWRIRVLPAGEATLADDGIDLRVPAGAVLRARRPGDRVAVRAGSRKLQDWYVDQKIPRRERESAPVLAYGNQVLWTPWGALGELPQGVPWRIACARA
jgi:tRNA(Ile)-lysidine synthase